MLGKKGTAGGRAALLLILALAAVGVASCGDSDDGGKASDATAAAHSSTDGGDKARVTDLITGLRDIYIRSDGDAFCAALTPDGRKEVTTLVPHAYENIKARDCPGIVTEFSRHVVGGGQKQRPVDVRRVTVKGDKATAVITGGLAGFRRIVPFRFEKTGGEWKLDDPITGPRRIIGMDYSIRLSDGD